MTGSTLRAWTAFRHQMGRRVRAVVDDSIGQGLAPTSITLTALEHRLSALETALQVSTDRLAAVVGGLAGSVQRNELELEAVVQRLEECLDFLRVQHELVRDALEPPDPAPPAGR